MRTQMRSKHWLLFTATFCFSPSLLLAQSAAPVSAVASENKASQIETASPFRPHLDSLEAFADFNKNPGEKGVGSTDGPTAQFHFNVPTKNLVPVSLQDSVKVEASFTTMFNEFANFTDSKAQVPLLNKPNLNYFMREAKVILRVDPKTHSPIATIIAGRQDLESGAFDTAMPNPDNSPLRGLTRVRSAEGIQFELNSKMMKSLSVALFNTGVGHPETMGENIKPHARGMTVIMSKEFFERLKASAAITRINYDDKAELRLNSGVVFESKDGNYSLFANHVYMPNKGNPLLPDVSAAWSLGAIQHINSKNFLTGEVTKVNNGTYSEKAVGFKHIFRDERYSVGLGLRKNQEGLKIEGRAAYNFGAK